MQNAWLTTQLETKRQAKNGEFYSLWEFQQYYGKSRGDQEFFSSSVCIVEHQPTSAVTQEQEASSSASANSTCSQRDVPEPVLQPAAARTASQAAPSSSGTLQARAAAQQRRSQNGVREPVLQPSTTPAAIQNAPSSLRTLRFAV